MDEAVLHINVDKRCSLWSHRKLSHILCLDQPIQTVANAAPIIPFLTSLRGRVSRQVNKKKNEHGRRILRGGFSIQAYILVPILSFLKLGLRSSLGTGSVRGSRTQERASS